MKIDEYDRKLLSIMQESSRVSAEALAQEIGLSTTAVLRRLKRLREDNVILREVVVVNPDALDLKMTFIVGVQMEREQASILDDFKHKAMAHPNVQQCYYVTGQADFILIILAKDMQEFELLSRELFMSNNNVRNFNTSIAMGKCKRSLELPVSNI